MIVEKFRFHKLAVFLIVYLLINVVSYSFYMYYLNRYKKTNVTVYIPILAPEKVSTLAQETVGENFGNISFLTTDCYDLSLISDRNNNKGFDITDNTAITLLLKNAVYNSVIKEIDVQLLKAKSEKKVQTDICGTVNDPFLAAANKLNINQRPLNLKSSSCKFSIDNPFKARARGLFFVFLFNIINAQVLISGYQLIRSKNKGNY